MTNFKPPKPPLFSGAREVSTVQDWLRKVRLYLEKCGVGQAQLVQRAEFFLAGDEGVWYKQYTQGGTDTVEWTVFEDALKDKFYPVNYKIDIVRRFLRAAQKNIGSGEYNQRFARFVPELDPPYTNTAILVDVYTNGLKPMIRKDVQMREPRTLNDAMRWAATADSADQRRSSVLTEHGR